MEAIATAPNGDAVHGEPPENRHKNWSSASAIDEGQNVSICIVSDEEGKLSTDVVGDNRLEGVYRSMLSALVGCCGYNRNDFTLQ